MAEYLLNRAICESIIAEARSGWRDNLTASYVERAGVAFVAQCVSEHEGVLRGYVRVCAFECGEWVNVAELMRLRPDGLDQLERLSDGRIKFY